MPCWHSGHSWNARGLNIQGQHSNNKPWQLLPCHSGTILGWVPYEFWDWPKGWHLLTHRGKLSINAPLTYRLSSLPAFTALFPHCTFWDCLRWNLYVCQPLFWGLILEEPKLRHLVRFALKRKYTLPAVWKVVCRECAQFHADNWVETKSFFFVPHSFPGTIPLDIHWLKSQTTVGCDGGKAQLGINKPTHLSYYTYLTQNS